MAMSQTPATAASTTARTTTRSIVGASLAGCATAILLGARGRARRGGREAARPGAFKRDLLALHPGLRRADDRTSRPARADHGSRRRALADPRLDPLGLDRSAARGGRPRPSTCAARSSTRWCARPRPRPPGVELMLGQAAHGLLRDGDGRVDGVALRDRERRGDRAAGAARDRRRRARLEGRRARRRRGKDAARTSASPTAATSRARCPKGAPDGSIWFLDPHWAAAFPTDCGLTFYAAMPTKDRLPEFKRDPERGAGLLRRRPARRRRRSVGAPGRTGARQARHDEPGARADRARPGARRRRRARRRPALRRRLRLGVPVGRMAGRLRRAGAARRRVARARPEALPPPHKRRAAAATPSSSTTTRPGES